MGITIPGELVSPVEAQKAIGDTKQVTMGGVEELAVELLRRVGVTRDAWLGFLRVPLNQSAPPVGAEPMPSGEVLEFLADALNLAIRELAQLQEQITSKT